MKQPQGFTLIEFIIAIGLFAFMITILTSTLMSIHRFKSQMEDKKVLNQELVSVLNNGISGLIRSGFAIDYDQTVSNKSDGKGIGPQETGDQLAIFTDQAETNSISIYRKPFTENDELEGGQLFVRFNEENEVPLHSSEVMIEDFDIRLPEDPRMSGDRDVQPYVQVSLRGAKKMDSINDDRKPLTATYSTTYTLRNTSLASYKNEKSY